MNIFVQTIIASTLALKRLCPKCGRAQIEKSSKKNQIVKCKYCGTEIPPSRK